MTHKVLTLLILVSSIVFPSTVHAGEKRHLYSEPGKATVTARNREKEKRPPPTDNEIHLRIQNLVNTFIIWPMHEKEINRTVRTIALHRYIDARKRRLRPKVYTLVEDTLLRKIIAGKNFTIKGCMECDPEKLVVPKSMVSMIGGPEFDARLEKVARRIRVDGFLLWNVYMKDGIFFLNVAIVDAKSRNILWRRRFSEAMVPVKTVVEPESKYEKIITVGTWGHKVSRTYKQLTLEESEDRIGAVSFRLRRDAKDNRNFSYGIGGGYFKNIVTKDDTNLYGITAYAHLNYKLDNLIYGVPDKTVPDEPAPSDESTDDLEIVTLTDAKPTENRPVPTVPPKLISKYNLYLDLGEAFFMGEQTEFVKTGIEVRTKRNIIIDIGAVYLPKVEAIMTVPSGYNPTVSFGGASYEISLGYIF